MTHKKFPVWPKHPERICWGCAKYCPANDLQCGNGSERIQHPLETDGVFWYRQGDWQNLLDDLQLQALGRAPAMRAKPHIRLTVQNHPAADHTDTGRMPACPASAILPK